MKEIMKRAVTLIGRIHACNGWDGQTVGIDRRNLLCHREKPERASR